MGAKSRFKRDFDPRLRQRADLDVKSRRAASSTWLSSPRWRGCSTRGGAETSKIAGDGNRAPTHAQKKSRFIAWFSLSMGGVLPTRLLDLMLLRLDGDGDLRQQEAARLLTETHVRGSPGATARR